MNLTILKTSPLYPKSQIKNKQKNIKVSENYSGNLMSFMAASSKRSIAGICAQRYAEHVCFENFLIKRGKVSKEEYEEIKRNHPSLLTAAYKIYERDKIGAATPKDVAVSTLRVENYLKENYDKFRIISIGTSPSPITEQLAQMGYEVVFLPASGISSCYDYATKTINYTPQLRMIMQYLDTKNIDDDKLNLILDFTSSGDSLKCITRCIKEYFGLSDDKVRAVSVNEDILDFYYDETRNRMAKDFINSNLEPFSNVPHFPLTGEDETYYDDFEHESSTIFLESDVQKQEFFEDFESYSNPSARAFALCTMAQIEKLKQSLKESETPSHDN